MNPNSISSTDTKQICLKLIQSSPWATKKKMDLESHVGVLQYHWAVHQIPQPIVDVLICAVQDTLSNVNSYVHIKWHWPCVLKMCSKTPEQKHYRILPNRTAPPIEPPQLYSEVIEDNFLFKTLFTDWKSDHFWPRYGHFLLLLIKPPQTTALPPGGCIGENTVSTFITIGSGIRCTAQWVLSTCPTYGKMCSIMGRCS